MNHRENYLRAATFRSPAWIPCAMGFSPVTVARYGAELDALMREHPRVFPEHDPAAFDLFDSMPPAYREGELYTDNWGCVWRNIAGGLEGQVVGHPLSDWKALDTWRPPDPMTLAEREDRDWAAVRREMNQRRDQGLLTHGWAERLFDRLYLLRGFENLMVDFAEGSPYLDRLIRILTDHELAVIRQFTAIGVDMIGFHTDIGTQRGLMISPAAFRARVKPMFAALFHACREAGSIVLLSSDGRLLEIVDDLVECGVTIHDPQLRANGIEGIRKAYKGRLCASVDLDRQSFPFLTPAGLRDQVKEVVDAMADPRGGLMLSAAVSGEVPLRNIHALCEAFEEHCFP